MTFPDRSAILEKAKELFLQDSFMHGSGSTLEPEESELIESGYVASAKSLLMQNPETKFSEYMPKIEKPEKPKLEIETKTEGFFDILEALDTGFFISGTSQSGKTNLAKWLVKALIEFGVAVYVLDTSQAWNESPISNVVEVTRNKEEYDFGKSTIFDLSGLELRDKVRFVNETCKHVFKTHVAGYRKNEFLVFEEAQTYMPNGSFRLSTRRVPIYEGAVNVVTVGANYGVRFGLITQFPSMVDKAPVKIAMQRYFGWTLEKNDSAYIRSFIGKENIAELSNLKRGQFLYQNRGIVSKIETQKFQNAKTETSKNSFNVTYESWNVPSMQN